MEIPYLIISEKVAYRLPIWPCSTVQDFGAFIRMKHPPGYLRPPSLVFLISWGCTIKSSTPDSHAFSSHKPSTAINFTTVQKKPSPEHGYHKTHSQSFKTCHDHIRNTFILRVMFYPGKPWGQCSLLEEYHPLAPNAVIHSCCSERRTDLFDQYLWARIPASPSPLARFIWYPLCAS